MTARTFKFYGIGWGQETAKITVLLNGKTVFLGDIPTIPNQPISTPPGGLQDSQLLFEITDIAVTDEGPLPLSITVNAGNLVFGQAEANYMVPMPNPVYTPEQYAIVTNPSTPMSERVAIAEELANPPLTPEEIAVLLNPESTPEQLDEILSAHNIQLQVGDPEVFNAAFWPSDSRLNVYIDGIPQTITDHRPPGLDGDWTWNVYTFQVFECNFEFDPGLQPAAV